MKYFARVPPKFRATLQRLRNTIKVAAPDAKEGISDQKPAFRQNGMLVYFAAFKDHCSLFAVSSEVRRQFSAERKPFMAGKARSASPPTGRCPPGWSHAS